MAKISFSYSALGAPHSRQRAAEMLGHRRFVVVLCARTYVVSDVRHLLKMPSNDRPVSCAFSWIVRGLQPSTDMLRMSAVEAHLALGRSGPFGCLRSPRRAGATDVDILRNCIVQ